MILSAPGLPEEDTFLASKRTQTILRAAGIGAIAGLRSISAPAVVSRELVLSESTALEGSPLALLATPAAANVLQVLAAGEIVADKTPFVPDRTDLLPLLGRAGTGALAGASVAVAGGSRALEGAFVGATAAVAATYAAYHLRRFLSRTLHIPDCLVAIAEDAVVVRGGIVIARQM
jgi:uncharacterized membrane protein